MTQHDKASPETLVVHAGTDRYQFGPLVPPIYETSTFYFTDAEQGAALFASEEHGYIYSRMGNPTVEALGKCIAALEGGHRALACASGELRSIPKEAPHSNKDYVNQRVAVKPTSWMCGVR